MLHEVAAQSRVVVAELPQQLRGGEVVEHPDEGGVGGVRLRAAGEEDALRRDVRELVAAVVRVEAAAVDGHAGDQELLECAGVEVELGADVGVEVHRRADAQVAVPPHHGLEELADEVVGARAVGAVAEALAAEALAPEWLQGQPRVVAAGEKVVFHGCH